MIVTNLPKQPPPFISYLKVGKLLYYSLILFVIEAWFYGLQLRYALLHQGVLLIISSHFDLESRSDQCFGKVIGSN